jgi:DNA polymerase-3 subunit gamma/tau
MGPFGPYIKYQNCINIALSKKLKENWETITLDECLPIIEKGKNKKAKQTTSKDKKESKQVKEPKEPKQVKETKEPKQVKQVKETKEPKQVKQVRKPKQKQIMLEL